MRNKKIRKTLIALLIALALATAALAQLKPGDKAPDFTLPTLDGKNYKLSSNWKAPGKVVLLDIWATWCPPCRAEVPYLVDLHKYFKGKAVSIVGVSIDDNKEDVKSFVKENKVKYAVVHDADKKVADKYNVRSIPTTLIIDKKGVIRHVYTGFPGDKEAQKKEIEKMKKEIQQLLDKKDK